MRTVKTALCVFVCLAAYEIFSFLSGFLPEGTFSQSFKQSILEGSPSFACIAAVICMQDNIEDTKKIAVSRIIGSLVGGGSALAFTYLNKIILSGRLYIVFSVIGVVLIICVCNFLGNPVSVSISVITFLIIFVGTDVGSPIFFTINRITGTLLGAFAAFVVNKYISPPKE